MAEKKQPHLVITRIISITQRVPLDQDHYPDMTQIQAIDFELRLPRGEKIQAFLEALELFESGAEELTESVRVEK